MQSWFNNQNNSANATIYFTTHTKNGRLPDAHGQLWKFTDIYHIDIHCCNVSETFHSITLTGVHVPDTDICVPPDVMTFSDKCWISYKKPKKE